MAKNYVSEGNVLQYTPLGHHVKSGDIVIIGSIVGVAQTDIADGATGSIHIRGVYSVPKAADKIDQGAKLYWDAKKSVLTTTSNSNVLVGFAFNASTSAESRVQLLLSPAV